MPLEDIFIQKAIITIICLISVWSYYVNCKKILHTILLKGHTTSRTHTNPRTHTHSQTHKYTHRNTQTHTYLQRQTLIFHSFFFSFFFSLVLLCAMLQKVLLLFTWISCLSIVEAVWEVSALHTLNDNIVANA